MSTDYFFYAQGRAVMVGSENIAGISTYTDSFALHDFVKWAITENVKNIKFLTEDELATEQETWEDDGSLRAAHAVHSTQTAIAQERERCAAIAKPIEPYSSEWSDYEKQAYDLRTVIYRKIVDPARYE